MNGITVGLKGVIFRLPFIRFEPVAGSLWSTILKVLNSGGLNHKPNPTNHNPNNPRPTNYSPKLNPTNQTLTATQRFGIADQYQLVKPVQY